MITNVLTTTVANVLANILTMTLCAVFILMWLQNDSQCLHNLIRYCCGVHVTVISTGIILASWPLALYCCICIDMRSLASSQQRHSTNVVNEVPLLISNLSHINNRDTRQSLSPACLFSTGGNHACILKVSWHHILAHPRMIKWK